MEQREGIHQLYLFNNQLIDTPKSDTITCIYPKPLQKANLLLTDVFQTIIELLEDIIKIKNLANSTSTTKILQHLGIIRDYNLKTMFRLKKENITSCTAIRKLKNLQGRQKRNIFDMGASL